MYILICKICNKESKNLSYHLNKVHNINAQDYYDKFILENIQDSFANCKNKKKFINIRDGYKKYCNLGWKCKKCQLERNKNVSLNHADVSGSKNSRYDKKKSFEEIEKMRNSLIERNKNLPRETFNPFDLWIKKYGLEEALNREKNRREKEWNTKLDKLSNDDNYSKYLYSSSIELFFIDLLKNMNFNVKTPDHINKWLVDINILDLEYYIQIDGIFYHGLDKKYSLLEEYSKNKGGLYSAVYGKFKKDRDLDLYCIKNNIKFCRLTDIELKQIQSSLNLVNCWNPKY